MSRSSLWREWTGRLLLVVVSIAFSLLCLELAVRAERGRTVLRHWPNIVLRDRPPPLFDCAVVHDPLVGWLPCRNARSAGYTTDADGFRPMPPLSPEKRSLPAVLATGDSFTEGLEVADDETYPYYLQQRLGRRVVNGGVSAYGLDQTVLRTEVLAKTVKPAAIVVSFIADDLRRLELSRAWSGNKPYFALDGGLADGRLVLEGVPVPSSRPSTDTLNLWQRLFGWSVLIDEIVDRLDLRDAWVFDNYRVAPPGTGRVLACALMRRLATLPQPILVVGQYWRDGWAANPEDNDGPKQRAEVGAVLRCAAEAGLRTLDSWDLVDRAVRKSGVDEVFRIVHHAPAGNRLVADAVAAALQEPGVLP
jgi:hypothetical protein